MQQTANHTLYARWSPKTFTVSFNSQGGSTVSSKTVTYDSTYGSLTNPTKSGYTFAGWFTAASGGSQITASTKVALTANQVLYAHWTANSYTLSFNSQGGSSISAKTVTYGSKYGTLSSPTRTGYTFAGWYTAASGGSQVTSSTTVSTASNHTLYARWTANKYTVTYDKNGGSGDNFTRSIAYDSPYGKAGDPTRTGYEFHGWYTSKTYQTQVVETTLMKTAANHTLYAKWTPKTYTVTFMDGGTRISSKTVTYDSTYGTLPSRSMTGHTFNGWYTAASGGSRIIESANVTITANQTLYAQWSVNKYTVTYDKNGGSGSNFTRSIAYGSNYGKVDNPTKTGYNFAGWFTAKSGGSEVTETTKMTSTSNHTLYAHWTPKTYTVSFSSQGGGTVFAKTVTYDSIYGELASPNKAGYDFAGWYTAASGGAQVKADTKVTITADQTLYAHYTPKTYTVTFMDGGTRISTKNVTYDSTYGTLPSRSMTGQTFNGWYTAASGGSRITESTKVTITANHTLYAQWTIKYTVTYDLNGGDGDNFTKSIEYGSVYGSVADPTREGCEFKGWYTAKTGGDQVFANTIMNTKKNHTLYAHWEGISYTVVFHDVPGAENGEESERYSTAEKFRVKYNYVESKPFKWFKGWSRVKNAKEPEFLQRGSYHFRSLISLEILTDSNPNNNRVDLYPVWESTTYTVTYSWGFGSQDVVHTSENDSLTKGEVNPPAVVGEKQFKQYFIGWSPDKNKDTYVYSNESKLREVLPLMDMDNNTLYAMYGYMGDAPSYILNSQYTIPVWTDSTNVSIFIPKEYIDRIIQESNNWNEVNSSSGAASTKKYDMFKQMGCAIHFTSLAYTLDDVYRLLNSEEYETIDKRDLLYLEIRLLNTTDGVSIHGIYKNHVAPRHDGGKWYDLYYFSNSLSINNPARKVLIISFDPYIDVDGKKVRQHELIQSINDVANKPNEWLDPIDLAKKFARTMEEASYGNVKYIIDDKNIIILDEFPKDTSGNSYKGEDYLQTLKDAINWKNEYNARHDEKKGWADYPFWLNFCRNSNCKKCEDPYDDAPYKVKDKDGKVIGDPYDVEPDYFTFDYDGYFKRFDVYNRVNSKEIDEVWIFMGPRVGLKAYESMMTGKDAFWINGTPLVKAGQRNYATYGFNFERGLDCMLEDAAHRMERTMDRVFFGKRAEITEKNYKGKKYEQLNEWEKFFANDVLTKGKIVAGVGNVHCGPNAREDYDFNNTAKTESYCDNWLSYPDISGKFKQVDSSEWDGTQEGHHIWWFRHIPHVNMRNGLTGKYCNWWWYFNFCDLQ